MKGYSFFGLAAVNVGLAAGIVYVVVSRNDGPRDSKQIEVGGANTNPARVIKLTSRSPSSEVESAPRFSWKNLESSDYRRYIANLRAIGCPEETIQDIIVAEVNKKYSAREAALKLRREHAELWELPALAGTQAEEKQRKLRELFAEKRALLKDLLGIEPPVELSTGADFRQSTRFEIALKMLPESKREEARLIQQRYWDRTQQLQQRTRGEYEPEDQEESVRIRRERREALAKLLSPQELEDLELRTANSASSLRSQLAGFDASEREFREVFRIRQGLEEGAWSGRLDPGDPEIQKRRSEVYQQAETQIKAALGEERYAEYQRAQDSNFRGLADIAQRYGLPKETAVKGYEIQKTALGEIQKLQTAPAATPEQRTQALTALKAETEAAMVQTFGERAFNRYKRTRPDWFGASIP